MITAMMFPGHHLMRPNLIYHQLIRFQSMRPTSIKPFWYWKTNPAVYQKRQNRQPEDVLGDALISHRIFVCFWWWAHLFDDLKQESEKVKIDRVIINPGDDLSLILIVVNFFLKNW